MGEIEVPRSAWLLLTGSVGVEVCGVVQREIGGPILCDGSAAVKTSGGLQRRVLEVCSQSVPTT